MHKNYFTLCALAAQAARHLSTRRFLEAYSHQPDELIAVFLGEDGMIDLRVVTGMQNGCVLLTPHANPPKRNVMRFFTEIAGATVSHVEAAPNDRVIVIALGEQGALHVRMFGSGGGNVVRVDATGADVETFKKAAAAPKTARAVRRPWREIVAVESSFTDALRNEHGTLAMALNTIVPELGKPLVEEIVLRAGQDAQDALSEIDDTGMSRVYHATTDVIEECLTNPRPRVYLEGDARFALIPLRAMHGRQEIECADVSDGLRRWLSEYGKADGVSRERRRIEHVLRNYREHLARSLETGREELRAHDEEPLQRWGSLLLANIATIPAGLSSVEIDGEHIALDPTLSIAQNAAKYFDKVKRRRAALEETERRLGKLASRLVVVEACAAAFESAHTRSELEEFVVRHHDILKIMEERQPNAPRPHPFRCYRLSDECEVYVGKNARQNDELTFRFAKQNDLWFHVRGAEGSHAILRFAKREQPPREFILKAAAIAAFHSKAKNSSLVPVIYTPRKYVHKPRGAPPGTVACQREDVVMVAPAVPLNDER